MSIRVKIFASLREQLGIDTVELPSDELVTVADVWATVAGDTSPEIEVLMAVNLEYATPDQAVADGDEVAFFPPVTGG